MSTLSKIGLIALFTLLTTPIVCATTHFDNTLIQGVLDNDRLKYRLMGVQFAIKDLKNGVTHHYVSGVSNRDTLSPLKNRHLMQIGSTTKSFIAAIVLKLEADSEAGRLETPININQRIGHWLPEYPAWKNVTISQLLHMTSGIFNYTENSELYTLLSEQPHRIWKARELIDLAYYTRPNIHFPSGTNYEYSNTNYVLLGLIIEKATGKSLEHVIKDKIFRNHAKLFRNTHYSSKTYPGLYVNKMAHGYMMIRKHMPFYHKDVTNITLSWANAAGSIISNAKELAEWPPLLLSNHFLPKKQHLELMKRVCVDDACEMGEALPMNSKLAGYGMGIGYVYDSTYGNVWTHTGGTLGYHTVFIYMPDKQISVSVIVNQIGPAIKGEDDVIVIARDVLKTLNISKR